jgi:hypothetical protein
MHIKYFAHNSHHPFLSPSHWFLSLNNPLIFSESSFSLDILLDIKKKKDNFIAPNKLRDKGMLVTTVGSVITFDVMVKVTGLTASQCMPLFKHIKLHV